MTEITLLDGGIGQEIMNKSGDTPTRLWSTQVMIDRPGIVENVHRDYFGAGATVATTNTYAIHRDRLGGTGLEDKFEDLIAMGVVEAIKAREANQCGRVAGSIGPLRASYRPDLVPPPVEAAKTIAELAGLLAPRVDLLILETIPSVAAAKGALLGCQEAGKPVWLAVTVMDEDGAKLRSGEPLGKLAAVINEFQPEAVLVNCSTPEAIEQALEIVQAFGKPFGAYANGFVKISDGFLEDKPTVDALEARNDLGPAEYADFAMNWVGMGATIIGGCCETGPAHIAEIARRLERSGFEIV